MEISQALVSGLLIGSIYALVAVGLTLIWGVMDLVNFAHGNLLMGAMYVVYFLWSLLSLDPLVGLPIAMLSLAAASVAMYYVAIRPVLKASILAQMLVTFGVLIFLEGLAHFFFTPHAKAVAAPIASSFRLNIAGVVTGGPQLVAGLGAILGLLSIWWILERTETGFALSAVAQDRQAAQLMGISPDRMFAIAWAISGASLGVAGALLMNYFAVDPYVGFNLGLVAFVVVSIGGFGSISGALLGGLLMGVVQTVVGLAFPAYGFASIFLFYLLVTFVRPQGILGKR